MKRNSKHTILFIFFLITGIIIGSYTLSTPKVYNGSDTSRFSAISAARYLNVIAKKPHSIHDKQSHEEVYQYLYDELEKMDLNPQTYEYIVTKKSESFPGYNIKNIFAKLDGKSEDAILLVAHYDSAYGWDYSNKTPLKGVSYGAADDGYGIATILETVRAIKELETPLENDVLILFTDSEEADLDGATNALEKNPELFEHVNLVINIEARGIKGPAIMFETGDKNSSIIEYFNKNAKSPFSSSLATDIYRIMPNGSDFSVFLKNGFNGMNFAVVDNLDYYHTEKDSYENIDLESIQHYGEQIFSLIKSFSLTPNKNLPNFEANSNEVFFNILRGIMVNYSEHFAVFLLIAVIVSIIVLIAIVYKNHRFKVWKIMFFTVVLLVISFACSLFATSVPYLLAKAYGLKFNLIYLTHIPNANFIFIMIIAIVAFLFAFVCKKIVSEGDNKTELLLAGISLNLIFAALTTVFLTGASYLFIIPVILVAIIAFIKYLGSNALVKYIVLAIMVITVCVLYIPILYLLNCGLTIGAVGISVGLFLIVESLIIPTFLYLTDY